MAVVSSDGILYQYQSLASDPVLDQTTVLSEVLSLDELHSLKFSASGQELLLIQRRSTVPVTGIDVETGKVLFRIDARTETPTDCYCAIMSSDSSMLALGLGNDVILVDQVAGDRNVLSGHRSTVTALCFLSHGATLISASSDRTIRIWDLKTQTTTHVMTGHSDPIDRIALTDDGKCLLSISTRAEVCLWNVASGHVLTILQSSIEGSTNQNIWSYGFVDLRPNRPLRARLIIDWPALRTNLKTKHFTGGRK